MKSFFVVVASWCLFFCAFKWWFTLNVMPFVLPTIIVDIPHAKNIQAYLYAHNRWLTHRLNKLAVELLH